MVKSIINKSLIRDLTLHLDLLTKLRQKAYSYPLLAMILSSCGSNTSSTTITDSLKKEEDLGEIRYTLVAEETFRKATLKLKLLLEKNNYDYNKVKTDHVFFVIDNGTTKLNWNTAVKRYLDKKQPKDGDYFLMKKFFY